MNLELVDRYVDLLASEGRLAESTLRSYGYSISHFCRLLDVLGVRDVGTVTRADIRAYMAAQMRCGVSSTTIRARMTAVRGMFARLFSEGAIPVDPTAGLPTRHAESRATPCRSYREVSLYLEAMPTDTPLGVRNRALAEVAYGNALSPRDLAKLDVGDVMLAKRIIGPDCRPLGAESLVWLATYLGGPRAELAARRRAPGDPVALFLSRTGERLDPRGIGRAISRSSGAGQTSMTASSLRQSCAYALAVGGMDPLSLNEFMGRSGGSLRKTAMLCETLRPAYPPLR